MSGEKRVGGAPAHKVRARDNSVRGYNLDESNQLQRVGLVLVGVVAQLVPQPRPALDIEALAAAERRRNGL